MSTLYNFHPCPQSSTLMSLEPSHQSSFFPQASLQTQKQSRVGNELFYAPQKRIKLENRFVNLPFPNQEGIQTSDPRRNSLGGEIDQDDLFLNELERENLPVAPVNQQKKKPLEINGTLNNHMTFLPSNTINSQPMSNFTSIEMNTGNHTNLFDNPQNVYTGPNGLLFNNQPNGFIQPSIKPSLPGLASDDPIWEYLAKEQEDFKLFVQKVKEIVAVCTNPVDNSGHDDESSDGEVDLMDDFGSDSDDEVFFPRETTRLRRTPGSKVCKKTNTGKKSTTKKSAKKSSRKTRIEGEL